MVRFICFSTDGFCTRYLAPFAQHILDRVDLSAVKAMPSRRTEKLELGTVKLIEIDRIYKNTSILFKLKLQSQKLS